MKIFISDPGYAVLSRINFSHHLRLQRGDWVAERWHDDKGEGGGLDPPQKWWCHLWKAPKQVYKRCKKMIEIKNPGWRLRWQCSRHTHWDGCSAFIASVYKCLHESASVYNSLQVSSSVYKSLQLQEFTKVCMRLQESASVCKCCTSINRLRFFFFQTDRHNQTTE